MYRDKAARRGRPLRRARRAQGRFAEADGFDATVEDGPMRFAADGRVAHSSNSQLSTLK